MTIHPVIINEYIRLHNIKLNTDFSNLISFFNDNVVDCNILKGVIMYNVDERG